LRREKGDKEQNNFIKKLKIEGNGEESLTKKGIEIY